MPGGFQPHELASRYNVASFREDEWHSYAGAKTKAIVIRHLSKCKAPSKWVLNAGAGVYKLAIEGWTEAAVDIFQAPIQGREHAFCASVEKLPFSSNSFGAVVCVGEVLGYCDPQKAIAEFARILTPAGLLICDFGSTQSIRYWLRKEHGRAADLTTDEYNNSPEPIWIYDPKYIASLIISHEFDIIQRHGTHTWSSLSRRVGVSMRNAARIQRYLEWIRLPTKWADIMTIVAVRDAISKEQP